MTGHERWNRPKQAIVRLFRRPPRRVFHGILVVTALANLWSFSLPGGHFVVWILTFWVVTTATLVWAVRIVSYLVSRRRGSHSGSAWWFAVAPVGSLVLALAIYAGLPLEVRWQLGKSDFAAALADVRADPAEWAEFRDRRVGTYTITHAKRVDGGVVFYEKTGSFLDNAGFAYMPPGQTLAGTDSFERPEWVALGDDWYAWTASW